MKNSKILFRLGFSFLIVSFIGFLDATYLAVKHYIGGAIPCSITQGCEVVTTSQYAVILNIPVALLGAIYYLIIFVLAVLYIDTRRESIINFISRFTIIGLIASLWFVYLQVFVIEALCFYCLISAFTSLLLFVLGLFVIKVKHK